MGQRFQSVFILPPIYMNQDNPNNRSEKVLVYHNQWLYGRGALCVNLDIIKRLNKAIKDYLKSDNPFNSKQDIINHHLERMLNKAITWASVQELNNETNFHKPEELIYNEEEKKPKDKQRSLKELLKYQDNNNGFFICIIDKNLKIKYTFLNGFEDKEIISIQTPKSYLNLFYSDEDLKKSKHYKGMIKKIKDFNKFKVIEPTILKDVIAYLNEKKPSWVS